MNNYNMTKLLQQAIIRNYTYNVHATCMYYNMRGRFHKQLNIIMYNAQRKVK